MSLRNVQRQAASRYGDLGLDLSASTRPQRKKIQTGDQTTTARLLRDSRLFSLPPPIPRPSRQIGNGIRNTNESDTATLAYPSRAAITTPASSLARGDWGLKRPLPSKAFKTTTPVIRMNANDTIDHITDFESAADHVMTLQKWQEMDTPITTPRPKVMGATLSYGRPLGAFEDSQDPKDLPKKHQEGADSDNARGWGVGEAGKTKLTASMPKRRWRHDAPWIAGMQAGEFDDYVRTSIKKRRAEFRDWLREKLAERSATADSLPKTASDSLDQGLGAKAQEEEVDDAADKIINEIAGEGAAPVPAAGEDVVSEHMLRLRSRQGELMEHVWEFLDLPGRFPRQAGDLKEFASQNLDVHQGPPSTHPSAGLSYLRPANIVPNHPSLGPMNHGPPVQARVLQRLSVNGAANTVFGVAGVTASRESSAAGSRDKELAPARLRTEGGPKMWVHVRQAQIDSKGRIQTSVTKSTADLAWTWDLANSADDPAAASGPGARHAGADPSAAGASKSPLGQVPDLSIPAGKAKPNIKPLEMHEIIR